MGRAPSGWDGGADWHEWVRGEDGQLQVGEYSDDKLWAWDGERWVSTVSQDGMSWWDGYQWVPLPGARKVLDNSAPTGLVPVEQLQVGEYSDDKLWAWDGERWVSTVSPDGMSWWDGYRWLAMLGARKVLVRTYKGKHGKAERDFEADANELAEDGWRPQTIASAQGSRKGGLSRCRRSPCRASGWTHRRHQTSSRPDHGYLRPRLKEPQGDQAQGHRFARVSKTP